MFVLRKSEERGSSSLDWLESRFTFSFADYHDPEFMGYRALRVMNEDWIAPGKGFGAHSHRDMEIITVPLSGALRHQDNRGNSGVLRPGMVQWMRAGRGITHSEMNASDEETVHLMQIWIEPNQLGLEADYLDKSFDFEPGHATLIASGEGLEGEIQIAQDARISYVRLLPGTGLTLPFHIERFGWVQWLTGAGHVGNLETGAGDGVMVTDESEIELLSQSGADLLLFDLS